MRLPGATIGGDLSAVGGTFKNSNGKALQADLIKVRGSVFVRDNFVAQGEVFLLSATVGGNLDATGGTFKNPNSRALNAAGIEVSGNVFLNRSFVAEGEVLLHGAKVNGQLEVEDAWLDALDLEGAHVTGGFFWRNIHADRRPDFPNKGWKTNLDLTNANVGALADEETSWPEKGRLRLDGFLYDRIGVDRPMRRRDSNGSPCSQNMAVIFPSHTSS